MQISCPVCQKLFEADQPPNTPLNKVVFECPYCNVAFHAVSWQVVETDEKQKPTKKRMLLLKCLGCLISTLR